MALVKCKECGSQVSTKAACCPTCGAKIKKKVGILGWLFALFVVLPVAWNIGTSLDKAEKQLTVTEQKATQKPRWEKATYEDKMTNNVKEVLSLRSLNAAEFDFPYKKSGGSYLTLSFRKNGNEFDAYLSIDRGQMMCNRLSCVFNMRIGDGEITTWEGSSSTTGDSDIMFAIDPKALESIIKTSNQIRISMEFYKAGSRVFEFDVSGYPTFDKSKSN